MNIKETAVEIHQNNIDKGFIDVNNKRNVGEVLMLVVSELGEALEADRKGRHFTGRYPKEDINSENFNLVKDTFEDEIADAIIRLFDISEEYGFDLEWHIRQKMNYNSTRPFKHGKKY